MKWEKLGNIFNPDLFQDWNFSFGAVPYVGEIKDNQVKIYFTGRDQDNRSHIHWAIFDFADNFKVLELSDVQIYGCPIKVPYERNIRFIKK